MIYSFLKTGLPEESVYVSRVLNNLPPVTKQSRYYIELNEMYVKQVACLINDRNTDAHIKSFTTDSFYRIILAKGGDQATQTERKMSLPELFLEQIEFAHKGFSLALALIQDQGVPKS